MKRLVPLFAVLPLLLQTGCWPRIPGKWEDHAAPDLASIVGQFWWTRYTGGYWSSGSPEPVGNVWFATFDEPKQSWPWKRFTDDLGDCTRNQNLPSWWSDFSDQVPVAEGGSASIVIRSETDAIELDYYRDGIADTFAFDGMPLFYKDIPTVKLGSSDEIWSMDELTLEGHEPFAVEEFVYVPAEITVTAPAMGGDDPPTLDRGRDIAFAWEGGAGADHTYIEVLLTDSSGGGLEIVQCVVENTGEYTLAANLFTAWDSASVLYIQVGSYTHTNRVLPGFDGGIRIGGITGVQGAAVVSGGDAR